VISIMSLLASITVPVFNGVRRKAQQIQGMNRLRHIGAQLNVFSNDNKDRYPPSVASVGWGEGWTWYDPRRIIGNTQRTPLVHRSMSAYLREYIPDASLLHCPSAPDRFEYLDEMWEAGDRWDNPQTNARTDPFSGSFCFYWNYDGLVLRDNGFQLFRGPRGPEADGVIYSNVLASDFFSYGGGYDNPPPSTYTSCQHLDGAHEKSASIRAPYWSVQASDVEGRPDVKLKAVFTDGHVGTYSSLDALEMHVIRDRKKREPFVVNNGNSPGQFYLPPQALLDLPH